MRSLFALTRRNIAAHALRTVMTALAIALGVGMIFAVRIVGVAVEQAADAARAERLGEADLEVTSATAGALIPAGLAERLAARSEVALVAPVYRRLEGTVETNGVLELTGDYPYRGTGLVLWGVDPAHLLAQPVLAAGRFFSTPDAAEVLLPAAWATQNGLQVGDPLALTTGAQTREYTIVGLLEAEADALPGARPTAWLPLATAQAAFETPGLVSSFLLRLKTGELPEAVRSDLQQELGPLYLVVSAESGSGVRSLLGMLTGFALPFATLAVVLAGAFLIYNAFAITLTERRRELGQLRTLGMTRGQVFRQTLLEALIVALIGSAVGLLVGLGLGRGLIQVIIVSLQGRALPPLPLPWDGALLAVAAGVLVTLAVTVGLAWRTGRVGPLPALRLTPATEGHGVLSYLWIGALGFLFVFIVALAIAVQVLWRARTANFALAALVPFLLGGAALLALPVALQGLMALPQRLKPARQTNLLRLAARNLTRRPGRSALTAATLTVGMMLVVALAGMTQGIQRAIHASARTFFQGDFLLVRMAPLEGASLETGMSLPIYPPIPSELQQELDALAQEADVTTLASIHLPETYASGPGLDVGLALSLSAVRDNPGFRVVEGSWAEAERYFAAGPALTLPQLVARRLNVHPGATVEVETLEGRVSFTVALVGGPVVVVTPEIGTEYFHAPPFAFFVTARRGQDPAALEDRLQTLARRYALGLTGDPQAAFSGVIDLWLDVILALFAGLTALTGLLAALAIVNTLVATVSERQAELGVLRALGMTRGQVQGLISLEAGWLGLTGALVGVVAGLGMTLAFTHLLNTLDEVLGMAPVSGVPLPWSIAGLALLTGPLLAMVAALYPAGRAAAIHPAEAMRLEGGTRYLRSVVRYGPAGLRGLLARMPLAARLSLAIGLILVVTIAGMTAVRVRDERQLLEENVQTLLARLVDLSAGVARSRIPAQVTMLTPELANATAAQSRAIADAFREQFTGTKAQYRLTLVYGLVTDNDRRVVYPPQSEYLGRVLTQTIVPAGSSSIVQLTDWTGERVFEAAVPIQNSADVRLGIAYLGFSTDMVDNVIRDVIRKSLWTTLAALAVSIALTTLLTRRSLSPIARIADASTAVAHGDLTRHVPETRWDEVGRLARAFNQMVRGLKEREQLRDLFGRFLSPEVSEAVLAGKVSLRGERRVITALYCDMRGSTTFAEAHPPEEFMTALNQYFAVIIQAVDEEGGIVNRFVGDAAVCVFGAPMDLPNHAECALRAALKIRAGLAELNRRRSLLNQPVLRFGIGISTGDVVAGATGAETRQEYTVLGDAMNLGARIEGLCKEYPAHDILLSEFTCQALGSRAALYTFADLGEVPIRGKTKPVRLLALVGRRE